jgi:hypothetical protein
LLGRRRLKPASRIDRNPSDSKDDGQRRKRGAGCNDSSGSESDADGQPDIGGERRSCRTGDVNAFGERYADDYGSAHKACADG